MMMLPPTRASFVVIDTSSTYSSTIPFNPVSNCQETITLDPRKHYLIMSL